ncbi:VOC family protein (plasmid) [Streptomyces coeruleorubidus]|uniref:VOC family protein n=1 Tax=Streptomyces coeruleorubidus TaxID=116188 RepID=A0ABZ0KSS1_STRC4|nr:VOC family protein [Streptomyces coeruleorubidus]
MRGVLWVVHCQAPAGRPTADAVRCPGAVPEVKAAKNRVHPEVRVGTGNLGEERLAVLEAESARLLPLGAVHMGTQYDGADSFIPMLDLEGNEFCMG